MTADLWPAKETLRLAKLKGYNILDTLPEPAYDDITVLAAHLCEMPTALVSLVDGDRQWFKSRVGLSAAETPRKVAFCDHTIQHSDILIVEDATQDPRFSQNPLVTGKPHIRFYAGAPLITPDGYALGSLCVIDYQPRRLTQHQRQGLLILSRQVVAQMELRLHAQQLKLANNHLEQRVSERTARLTSALSRLLKAQNQLLKREAALRHNSLHDPLTGLPNRSYFSQRLEQAIQLASRQPKHLYAVLFIDLDNFKPVNDTLGHDVGDKLLRSVASQIKQPLRKSDLVARLGGDEFAVLLDNIPNEKHAIVVVQRLQEQLKQPFILGTQQVSISASIGITFSRQGYRQPEAAIRDADVAMYRAKKRAKKQAQNRLRSQLNPIKQPSTQPSSAETEASAKAAKAPILIQPESSVTEQHFVVFNVDAQTQNKSEQLLKNELRQAILQDQFQLYYQPIFDLTVGSSDRPPVQPITGFEVLLRWHHPTRGCLEAENFIELAESIGILRQLSEKIIHTACKQIKQWRSHHHRQNLSLHINLSLSQLMDIKLLSQWEAELAQHQLPPSACQLEIIEDLLLSNDPTVMATLQGIQQLGMGLCIDNFGRGHTSLSRLHQLNVSTLKIDRAFVQELTHLEETDIVKTILDLGRSTDITVIAKGIETSQQLTTLLGLGCRLGQGFWLAEPMKAIAINPILLAR